MEEPNEIPQGSDPDKTFPAIDVDKELNPGRNTNFEVDPVSSQVAATKEIQEQSEAARTQKEREKKDALQTLKSAIIISAIAVAVAGAIFAITKKLKEK
ncbi:hypothetical protein Acr_08g0017880 [Actinidia rufa]|uniref:Transmembrane protein n=1 Tax=Actinidia rufa TaxID=165716 RepID=A0A7J0F3X8_9ERIC|nr:hypothetical protein Acr_08g0017880 [Actinidia rufa]